MERQTAARGAEGRTTREIILDVAERRFAEHGFAGVAVREIAADAGLKNQASLYNHFRNKRAIYEAVLTRGLAPLIALFEETGKVPGLRDESGPERFGPILDKMIDYLAERPNLPRLIQRAGLDDSGRLRDVLIRLLKPLYQQGMIVLEESGGAWQRGELQYVALGLYHMIFGYFASAPLLEPVVNENLRSRDAVSRQRDFLKAAVAMLLGVEPPQRSAAAAPHKPPRRTSRRATRKGTYPH